MRKELPDTLRYHSIDHTLDVMTSAEKIGLAEGINEDEMETLITAAAFHDCGFIRTYDNHEEVSCEIAAEILPDYGFAKNSIKVIQDMIMSTRVPQASDTLLGRILCDADLDYLGGEDYERISKGLLNELTLNGFDLSYMDWLDLQIDFLENHKFWTDYAITSYSKQKAKILSRLKKEKSLLS
ncbi:MAG: HD domain-containing protein [Flavobacteriales bacterium]|nr:HD domain-containing protein [Flavobacteriales bacterium]